MNRYYATSADNLPVVYMLSWDTVLVTDTVAGALYTLLSLGVSADFHALDTSKDDSKMGWNPWYASVIFVVIQLREMCTAAVRALIESVTVKISHTKQLQCEYRNIRLHVVLFLYFLLYITHIMCIWLWSVGQRRMRVSDFGDLKTTDAPKCDLTAGEQSTSGADTSHLHESAVLRSSACPPSEAKLEHVVIRHKSQQALVLLLSLSALAVRYFTLAVVLGLIGACTVLSYGWRLLIDDEGTSDLKTETEAEILEDKSDKPAMSIPADERDGAATKECVTGEELSQSDALKKIQRTACDDISMIALPTSSAGEKATITTHPSSLCRVPPMPLRMFLLTMRCVTFLATHPVAVVAALLSLDNCRLYSEGNSLVDDFESVGCGALQCIATINIYYSSVHVCNNCKAINIFHYAIITLYHHSFHFSMSFLLTLFSFIFFRGVRY